MGKITVTPLELTCGFGLEGRGMDRPLDTSEQSSFEGAPSFSLGNRLFRLLWSLTWLVLAAWTPPPLHGWRAMLLRAKSSSARRDK